MAVPSGCFPESKEIQGMKEEVINRIKFSYKEAVKKPFHTGIFGKKVKDCTTDDMEEVEVILPSDLATAQLLRARAVMIAEGYLLHDKDEGEGSEYDGGDGSFRLAFQPSAKAIATLCCGMLSPEVIIALRDVPAVIRDETNSYIEVTFFSLLRLAHLIESRQVSLLQRKWMLEEAVNNSSSSSSLQDITWESDYSDLDSRGK